MKNLLRDIDCPVVLVGWVLYYIAFFALEVIADSVFRLVVQIALMVFFLCWRWKKLNCFD